MPAVDTRIERHRNADSPIRYLGVLLTPERAFPVIDAALDIPARVGLIALTLLVLPVPILLVRQLTAG